MNRLHTLYHLMLADFLERVRSYGFLFVLLFAIFLTYFFVPALDAPIYAILNLGGYRPIYNSAWIGVMVTLLMVEFMPLFGFYLVRGGVERDRRTGVGQIIAATSVSKSVYTLGKWISNVAVFATMVLVMIVTSIILQLIRGESFHIHLWALASPLVIVLLPALAVVAALSVLFECVKWLRGTMGSVIYFLIYGVLGAVTNWQGLRILWPSVHRACEAHFPKCNRFRQIDIDIQPLHDLPTFRYPGLNWTVDVIAGRLAWLGVAMAIAWLAAVFFRRFEQGRDRVGVLRRIKEKVGDFVRQRLTCFGGRDLAASLGAIQSAGLSPLPEAARARPLGMMTYGRMLGSEFRLALKGARWWWYLGALGLIVATFSSSLDLAQGLWLPVAWLWPLFLWSAMGVREVRHRTAPVIFAAPYPLRRHLIVTWLVGVLVAFGMGSGVLVQLAQAAQWRAVFATGVGAFFIPTLALALGCWGGNSKLFEGLYLFLWYLAVVESLPYLDFMGRFSSVLSIRTPGVYAGLTGLLVLASFAGRRRQLKG
ncbi:MAG TPA: hypothetical protein ENN19_07780 [Chloroflexi bacterium]|nr:hypothetical protein [Chloroflexota bacterium]